MLPAKRCRRPPAEPGGAWSATLPQSRPPRPPARPCYFFLGLHLHLFCFSPLPPLTFACEPALSVASPPTLFITLAVLALTAPFFVAPFH
ncbi:hypothetical protein B0J12DRAFT_427226 [Macrophomina phaseolina]|uniref:Uncharacterized protein n=1 Tax=Macrophomina phaseolina TaxID=35725 RepID=A0ABQ8GJU0_9PEZI|nr:hypothetical protein B0J12DRAFT_427226 [Macrophomina phaseolina]